MNFNQKFWISSQMDLINNILQLIKINKKIEKHQVKSKNCQSIINRMVIQIKLPINDKCTYLNDNLI